jgi:hypothetical protein
MNLFVEPRHGGKNEREQNGADASRGDHRKESRSFAIRQARAHVRVSLGWHAVLRKRDLSIAAR